MAETSPGDVEATHRLQRYWTRGEGAAKIGWGRPGDFLRCTRLLIKYFPKNPKALCANLHHKALGVWPGQEDGGRHSAETLDEVTASEEFESMVADASRVLDTSRPMFFMAPIAAINTWTDENRPRRFLPGALDHRTLPVPLMWQKQTTPETHGGAQAVGMIDHIEYGDTHAVALGRIFPSSVVPDAAQFVALARAGVVGPSVDPVSYTADEAVVSPESPLGVEFSAFRIKAVTMVPTPAYPSHMLIWNGDLDDDQDPDHLDEFDADVDQDGLHDEATYEAILSSGEEEALTAAVLATGWENYPVAERRAVWKADDAIKRITTWSQGEPARLREVFLWTDRSGDPKQVSSYRLPVADINKEGPVLVYHAVYAAAALISGAHGGLPGIPENEKAQLKSVIDKIYAKFGESFGGKLPSPWGRGGGTTQEGRMGTETDPEASFGTNTSGWASMPLADPDTVWRAGAAVKRLAERAGGGQDLNWQKFGQGFLWHANNPEHRGDFKLPIADVVDGKLVIVPRAVNAVASVLGGGRGGVDIPDADRSRIQGIIDSIQKRMKGSGSMTASLAPLAPPKAWFSHPEPGTPTKMTVTSEGQVFGHIATWKTCHLGISGKCVTVPKTRNDYADFHVGQVLTADGDLLDVGHITAGGGHAALNLTADATRAHYDSTSQQTAIGRVTDGVHGPFFAGALVPEATEEQAAMLRRSPISGDWRNVDGTGLSLVAALCVNRPGFQIKTGFSADEDEIMSLVAAGVLLDETDVTVDDVVNAVEDRLNEKRLQYSRAARYQELLQTERGARFKNLMGE